MAQSGNGIDLGSVYQLLSEVAETVRSHSDSFTLLNGRLDRLEGRIGGVENRIGGVENRIGDMESQLGDLNAGVADLRSAVRDYHATVTGHGILYSELEGRVQRIERHLKLEPGE